MADPGITFENAALDLTPPQRSRSQDSADWDNPAFESYMLD